MKFEAAEILTTGKCLFNCRYCYIPKTSAMEKMHEEIIKSLEDGSFMDHLEKVAGNGLAYLSFWGTEPALTLSLLEGKMEELFKRFPRIKEISFSTSMMRVDPIISFAQALARHNPDVKLEIQISLDGPDFITDVNRFPSASKKIPENFLSLVEKLQDSPLKIEFHWKGTLTIGNIRDINKNPEKVDKYFEYFKGINEKFRETNKNKNIFLEEESYAPTLAFPGKYTSDDGKEFALFLKTLNEKGYRDAYSCRFGRLVEFQEEVSTRRAMFTCSGGDSNIGISDERIHICHRTFYFDNKEYINSVLNKSDIDNWDISLFERGTISFMKERYLPKVDDELGRTAFQYVLRGHHDFWTLQIAATKAMIRELAVAGQIDEAFAENDYYSTVFALLVNAGMACPTENILNTGTPQLTPLSLIRMFGNGAFFRILENNVKVQNR